MDIKIRYIDDILPLEMFDKGNWIDLRCSRSIRMKQGEYIQIPLGVAMQLPDRYEAIIAPRSSTFRRYGILPANGIGIIDSMYCGNDDMWCFPAYAIRDTEIPKDERICQFRILERQPVINFIPVDDLANPNRGGLGSTGRI